MTRAATCILFLSFTITAAAQSPYADSLAAFQFHYKKELYAALKVDTALVNFYPVQDHYRVVASVEKLQGQKFFSMATSNGQTKQAIKYLELKFELSGNIYTLYAYQLSLLLESEKYRDNFFIPFRDETNDTETYDGGRYIDFVVSDITPDNKLVIDFNKAYNPYCAFKEGYNCPIPPSENALAIGIKAGEKNFNK